MVGRVLDALEFVFVLAIACVIVATILIVLYQAARIAI